MLKTRDIAHQLGPIRLPFDFKPASLLGFEAETKELLKGNRQPVAVAASDRRLNLGLLPFLEKVLNTGFHYPAALAHFAFIEVGMDVDGTAGGF